MTQALHAFALGDAQHGSQLLLPFLRWLDLCALSSVSRVFAQQSVRDEFFQRSLVVVPDTTTHRHHVRAVLHRLSTFTHRIALSKASYLPALARLPALRTLRLAKPHGSCDPSDRLTAEHAPMIWRLESVVHLELDASFEASSDSVRSLFFKDMRRLLQLRLSLYFRISDLEMLSHLQRLESLDVTCAMLEDIEGLRALPRLKIVRLSSWMVQDFTPLEALVNCELLDLSRCNVSDLTPVGRLSRLSFLCLADTPVQDIAPLSQLTRLEHLSLARSNVHDVSALVSVQERLRHLDLSECKLTNAGAIRYLGRLQTLLLHNTTWDRSETLSRVLASLSSLTALDARVGVLPGPESAHQQQQQPPSVCLPSHALQSLGALTELDIDIRECERAELQLWAVGLQRLSLDCLDRSLADIPIAVCSRTRLTSFRLFRARMQGLENLRSLSLELRELHLIDVRMNDMSALQCLARLEVLVVTCVMVHFSKGDGTPTYSLTPLSRLGRLRHLDLSYTNFCDIQPLRHLDGLQYLNLSSTNLDDASPIAALRRLEVLHLHDTEIDALQGGSHCTRLREVSLPAQVDCAPVRRHAPFLRRLLHPEANCLWIGHE